MMVVTNPALMSCWIIGTISAMYTGALSDAIVELVRSNCFRRSHANQNLSSDLSGPSGPMYVLKMFRMNNERQYNAKAQELINRYVLEKSRTTTCYQRPINVQFSTERMGSPNFNTTPYRA